MQPLSPRAGCVTALNLKPEALLAFKNGPAFTLKSDKVIWIRENQCTAETPPPPPPLALSLQVAWGSWRLEVSP